MDGAGTSGEVTFDEPGTYPYFCARHPHMRGEVRVAPNA
ncbi:MAG: plastocyanin/azurin family copper-binding protein [Acidimicrobiia bacterium]